MLKYIVTFAVLLLLTLLTFGLSFVHMGGWEWPVALGIASVKGILIALYFMHLSEMSAGHRVSGVVAVLLLAVLILFAMSDVWTRAVEVGPKVETSLSRDQPHEVQTRHSGVAAKAAPAAIRGDNAGCVRNALACFGQPG